MLYIPVVKSCSWKNTIIELPFRRGNKLYTDAKQYETKCELNSVSLLHFVAAKFNLCSLTQQVAISQEDTKFSKLPKSSNCSQDINQILSHKLCCNSLCPARQPLNTNSLLSAPLKQNHAATEFVIRKSILKATRSPDRHITSTSSDPLCSAMR